MYKADTRLPSYDWTSFRASQLELAVVELKYPALARFKDESYLSSIKEVLSADYPLIETAPVMNLVVSPQGVSQSPSGTVLRFSTIDRLWTVGLGEISVSLESREYSDIDEFAQRFTAILADLEAHLRIRHQLRLGLRYVNEFRHVKGDSYAGWRGLLNPELLGIDGSDVFGGTVEHTITEIRTRRDDGTVLVRHGFLQGTTITPIVGQALKTGPFYLLDLDYFDETPHKFDVQAPAERIRTYNTFLYNVFRWAIGSGELYESLRGQA
jgi:uncharacterized protein (TIGR04255 family)